jgi:uncharacterized pyridoxal phosphate-containing UPF0001 family protein
VEVVRALPQLELRGLMAIPPPGEARPHFVTLRRLAADLGLAGLSMGMSDDFEAAIEEGGDRRPRRHGPLRQPLTLLRSRR